MKGICETELTVTWIKGGGVFVKTAVVRKHHHLLLFCVLYE